MDEENSDRRAIDPPPELVERVAEWGRWLKVHDWKKLAALYHPHYLGRRGAARYLSTAEELARLREEVAIVKGAQTSCRVTPLSVAVKEDEGRLTVEERLEQVWSDGCRRVTVRRFEQQWRCRDGTWLLFCSERVPRSERSCHEAAILAAFRDQLNWAEELLQKLDGGGPAGSRFERWLLREIVRILIRSVPVPHLGVQVDPGSAPLYAAMALERASKAAIEAWNRSLEGVLELRLHSGSGTPDIVIRAWDGPIYGSTLGVAVSAVDHRASALQAQLAEVWVALVEHAGTPALALDPTELYYIICHELGHCFGLDHCARKDECARWRGVMGPLNWETEPPGGPFLAERRAVLRWLEAAHRLLARDHRRLGQVEPADADEQRVALLQAEADRMLPVGPFSPGGLELEDAVVPAAVRHYWEGNAALRRRDCDRALACYDQVLADGILYPEALLRRSWLRGWGRESLADLRRAVEIAPSWALARVCLVDLLERRGHSQQVEVERAALRGLACREKIEERWMNARTARHWWLAGIAGALTVIWVVRYAAASIREQVVKARRRGTTGVKKVKD